MSLANIMKSGGNSSASSDKNQEGPFKQFEDCDEKDCIYYNEAGCCSYETCIIKNEQPQASSMVLKICKVCGNQFATNMNKMPLQICPTCLEGFLRAEGHPHDCIICGSSMNVNPSIFWPVCDSCMGRLRKYLKMWHCEHCG